MHPVHLISALVARSGKSTLQVAREMGSASFQGTLHKYINGVVTSPSRATAERIARYFKIPVDALYDATAAQVVADEMGIRLAPLPDAATKVEEAPGSYEAGANRPGWQLPGELTQRINALSGDHQRALERAIAVILDAIEPGG